MSKRIIFILILFLVASIKFIPSVLAVDDFVKICGGQLCYKNQTVKLKGFNFATMDSKWTSGYQYPHLVMWNSGIWDETVIRNEIVLLKNYGANTLRALIPYSWYPNNYRYGETDFGWVDNNGNVDQAHLDKLVKFIEIAKTNGMKVDVSLFEMIASDDIWPADWPQTETVFDSNNLPGGYVASLIKTDKYLTTIINRLKDETGVLVWDIKAEPEGIWATKTSNNWKAPWMMYFIKRGIDLVKSIDQNHPVTIGAALIDSRLFTPLLTVGNNSYSIADLSDIISPHNYYPFSSFPSSLNYIKSQIGTTKPVILEEVGWPTISWAGNTDWPGGTSPLDLNENKQEERINDAFRRINELDFSGLIVWIAFDAKAGDCCKFGLFRNDYSPKPAALTFRDNNFLSTSSFEVVSDCPRGDLGNLNCSSDGEIDALDLDILLSYWGSPAPTAAPDFSSANLDGQNGVDASDLNILLSNWGN